MIRGGMVMNLKGVWEQRQLSPELHTIVKKYRGNFNWEPVTSEHDLEGKETDFDD